jgi:hypothetical protein
MCCATAGPRPNPDALQPVALETVPRTSRLAEAAASLPTQLRR